MGAEGVTWRTQSVAACLFDEPVGTPVRSGYSVSTELFTAVR